MWISVLYCPVGIRVDSFQGLVSQVASNFLKIPILSVTVELSTFLFLDVLQTARH